jgi:tetratricopeptide (TPR) repeat protein
MKRLLGKCTLALVVPLVLVAVAEGVTRVLVPPPSPDAIRIFHEVRAPNGAEYRQRSPGKDLGWNRRYSVAKPPGVTRIACIGGSTVEGQPFVPEASFVVALERILRTLCDGREVEVLGYGVGGHYSDLECLAFDEALELAPDVVIVYSAHNEFHPANVGNLLARHDHPLRTALLEAVCSLRLATVIEQAIRRDGKPLVRPAESVAREAPRYRPIDSVEYRLVVDRFRHNLESMARRAAERGIALVLCTAVSNRRDFAPMADVFRADLGAAERERVVALLDRSLALSDEGRPNLALQLVAEAEAIDDMPARIRFARGRALLGLGRVEEARELLVLACDQDGRLNRATTHLNAVVREIAKTGAAILADVEREFDERSDCGIAGHDWIVDNVHPTLSGQVLIAQILAETLANAGLVVRQSDLERLATVAPLPAGMLLQSVLEERSGFANLLLALEKGRGGGTAAVARAHYQKSLAIDERPLALVGIGLLDALEERVEDGAHALRRAHAVDPTLLATYAPAAARSQILADLFQRLGVRFDGEQAILSEPVR